MATQATHFTTKEAVSKTADHHPPVTHPDFAISSDGVATGINSNTLSAPVDLNTTAPTPDGISIPAVLFAIPFPPAVKAKENAKRPSFLLYAPPREGYRKPPAVEDGKSGKEKLVKRVERGWQEEVAQGNAIKDGEMPNAGTWQKTKGALTRNAAKLIQWLPNSNIEALSRIPPKKKLHEAIVLMPGDPETTSPLVGEQERLEAQLERVRNAARAKAIASGVLLPVTGVMDWFIPIFAFEVDAAYFTAQLQGLRKATALTGDDVHLDLHPSADLGPLQARLLALCNVRAPLQFPDLTAVGPALGSSTELGGTTTIDGANLEKVHAHGSGPTSPTQPASLAPTARTRAAPPLGSAGGRILAEAIISAFRATVPAEVASRHALGDLDALTEDIERCLHKGADEYVKSL